MLGDSYNLPHYSHTIPGDTSHSSTLVPAYYPTIAILVQEISRIALLSFQLTTPLYTIPGDTSHCSTLVSAYDLPNSRIESQLVKTDKMYTASFRSPGDCH